MTFHYQGSTWLAGEVMLPGPLGEGIVGMWGRATDDVWAVLRRAKWVGRLVDADDGASLVAT